MDTLPILMLDGYVNRYFVFDDTVGRAGFVHDARCVKYHLPLSASRIPSFKSSPSRLRHNHSSAEVLVPRVQFVRSNSSSTMSFFSRSFIPSFAALSVTRMGNMFTPGVGTDSTLEGPSGHQLSLIPDPASTSTIADVLSQPVELVGRDRGMNATLMAARLMCQGGRLS